MSQLGMWKDAYILKNDSIMEWSNKWLLDFMTHGNAETSSKKVQFPR